MLRQLSSRTDIAGTRGKAHRNCNLPLESGQSVQEPALQPQPETLRSPLLGHTSCEFDGIRFTYVLKLNSDRHWWNDLNNLYYRPARRVATFVAALNGDFATPVVFDPQCLSLPANREEDCGACYSDQVAFASFTERL